MLFRGRAYRYELEDESLLLAYRKHINRSQNRHFHKSYEILLVLSGERQMFSSRTAPGGTAGKVTP